MSPQLTPRQAYDLEVEVVGHRAGQRASWVPLARTLHDFHAGEGWESRGHSTFNAWLGDPDVSIPRAEAYTMIAAWRQLVLGAGVPATELATVDLSKLAVVLPAIRQGKPWQEALADAQTLSRSDLRDVYQHHEPVEYRTCPACGQQIKDAA